ncbi:AI-2E family transporter, partial [bacterium]|nr:AI-2E family transporter [bacterium]
SLRSYLLFLVICVSVYILIIARPLIIPFVAALFVWYFIHALAVSFKKISIRGKKLPDIICLVFALVTIFSLIAVSFNIIISNINQVIDAAPVYQAKLVKIINRGVDIIGLKEVPSVSEIINKINFGKIITSIATALTSIAGNIGIIFLYVLFILLEQKSFNKKITALCLNSDRETFVRKIINRIDKDIRQYITIKTLLSFSTAFLSYLIMAFMKVDFAVFWTFLIFIFNFIPTIGSILATIFPSILALIQFEAFTAFAIVTGGIISVQFVIGSIIEPKLMGSTLNLSPLVIILSLTVWGTIWGITGMFLGVPLMAVLMIVMSHFNQTRPIAVLLSQKGILK